MNTTDALIAASKFRTKRNFSASRSSSIRKLSRLAAIAGGVRPLVMPRPTYRFEGRKFELHPTKGYRTA